jgi:hypothetical protein
VIPTKGKIRGLVALSTYRTEDEMHRKAESYLVESAHALLSHEDRRVRDLAIYACVKLKESAAGN